MVSKMDNERRCAAMKSGGENLMLRKTQGDLLQKFRQLRQWQQQQQEQLLQDKEKKLSVIREQDKRLLAVQDYQRRILTQSGNFGSTPNVNVTAIRDPVGNNPSLFHMQTHGKGFQEIPAARQSEGLQQGGLESNMLPMGNLPSARLMAPPKTVLLSPKHFQTAISQMGDGLDAMNSPDVPENTRPHDPMLLTQKIRLPLDSDEELSQFTDVSDDDSSIDDIDGIRPIEDTASEASLDDGNISDSRPLDELNDENDELNDIEEVDDNSHMDDTLVESDGEVEKARVNKGDILMSAKHSFDDIPIKSGLGSQTKTFEELLDERIENHEEPAKQNVRSAKVPVKRSFLRKGEGIARFGYKVKKSVKGVKKTQIIEKTIDDNQNKKYEQNSHVTRKIAPVQENTRQSSNVHQKKPENATENEVLTGGVGNGTATVVTMGTPVEEFWVNKDDPVCVHEMKAISLASPVIEDSFQERMKKWDEIDFVEKQELNEFELLEEAAADCSLSSNSSTVLRILSSRKVLSSLDQNNNLPRTTPERMNNGKDENIEVEDDVNNTLTEDKTGDEGDDTLKAEDPVGFRLPFGTSLALSNGFDDSETWEDYDDVPDGLMASLNTSTPEIKSRTKISKAPLTRSPQVSSTPPTSILVTKLFPQLKTKENEGVEADQASEQKQFPKHGTCVEANEPSAATAMVSETTTDSMNSRDVVGNAMSSAVREKLQELEKEIEKFREENATLHRLREEREKDFQLLQREKSLFESKKSEELERLEKFKEEEERRLRRDKRIFEQYQKASRALPDKKEREEITTLKAKINELQEDVKLRESRWSAAATRYKDRIANLEKENREMKEEVKVLEKQNLEFQRKDQQKTRELQQLKAFEKRKLSKPEELQAKSALNHGASQPSTSKEEHSIKEHEKRKTPPNTPPIIHEESQKQAKVTSDKGTSRVEQKDLSLGEKQPTKEHSSPKDTQKLQKTSTSGPYIEAKESSSATAVRLKELSPPPIKKANPLKGAAAVRLQEPSPPSIKANPSKSVRFKDDDDDDATEESEPPVLPKEICHNDGKREVIKPDGSRVVTFSNGTRKEISADGLSVIVTFFNGDVKQVMPDERVVYYYAETQTTHTTYPDGMQVLNFPSNQIEKHYPDGTKEIIFPDQTVKYFYQSGDEECVFADGTVERISGDGSRTVEFPNGQRETYTKLFKKREYPDGTVKTIYTDGKQETRYPSGRLRVKDGEGRLLVDTADGKQTTP